MLYGWYECLYEPPVLYYYFCGTGYRPSLRQLCPVCSDKSMGKVYLYVVVSIVVRLCGYGGDFSNNTSKLVVGIDVCPHLDILSCPYLPESSRRHGCVSDRCIATLWLIPYDDMPGYCLRVAEKASAYEQNEHDKAYDGDATPEYPRRHSPHDILHILAVQFYVIFFIVVINHKGDTNYCLSLKAVCLF